MRGTVTQVLGSVAALALLAGAVGAAPLGTVYIKYSKPGAVGVAAASFVTPSGPTFSTGAVYTGAYLFEVDATQPRTGLGLELPVGTEFGAVCIDISQHASPESQYYEIVDLADAPLTAFAGVGSMGDTRAAMLKNLWETYFDLAWIGPGPYTTTQGRMAEAFSAAVWEIAFERESTLNILDGALTVAGVAESAQANTWLGGLSADGQKAELYALASGDYQDYVFLIPLGDKQDRIPEPLTMTALVLGAGMLTGYVRHRKAR